MRLATTFGIAALLLAVTGCRDLPPISVGVCGNGVAEPDQGEDCDGAATADGAACGAPGTPKACRYVCQEQPDCPMDFGCGLDGICRASSSTWSSSPTLPHRSAETPLDLVIGNADDDGRGDVFEQAPSSVVVHYDVTSSSETDLTVAREAILPVIGPVADLSGDHLSDAVVPVDIGYFVSLGNTARVERATAYGAIILPGDVADVRAVSAEVLPDEPGNEILVLAVSNLPNEGRTPVIVNASLTGALTFIGRLPDSPSRLAGPARAGRLNEDAAVAPCDDLVLGYQGKGSLDLFRPCAVMNGQARLVKDGTTTALRLPDGATVAGAPVVEDLDGDGHLDLVVPAVRGTNYEIDVAYGRGDGTFDSVRGANQEASADQAAGRAVTVGASAPLAVYDLDGDGGPDWVDDTGVRLSRGKAPPLLVGANLGARWTTAVIAPLDGDALPDVAAGSSEAPGITWFLNAGKGSLTSFPVETRGAIVMLDAGDFDGDRVGDLAAVTRGTGPTATGGDSDRFDTLSVVFGSAFGAPKPPKDIGEFRRVHQVATARVYSGALPVVDAADELGALAEDEDGTLAFSIIFGQGNRDLRSPYDLTLTTQNDVGAYVPFRIVVGDADGDGHPDVISLAYRFDDERDFRITANPMRGNASIRLGQSTFSEHIESNFDWEHVLVGALDLDGEPGDEVVVLGPRSDGKGHQAAVARASRNGSGGATYSLGEPTPLDEAFTRVETALPSPATRNGRLIPADLDGDGATDLVALGQRGGRGELVVFFNEGTGELGRPAFVENAEELDVLDFAIVKGEGDRRPELALLTSTGVYVAGTRGGRLTVASTPGLPMTASAAAPPMLIAAGDLDGDGVPDLALSNPFGFELHLGKSANPNDAH